ncbi:MAG: hypothetical protein ACLGG7_01875 [Bacteriovoracia bacterium]
MKISLLTTIALLVLAACNKADERNYDLDPSTICEGVRILGVSGTAQCSGTNPPSTVPTTLDVSQTFVAGSFNALSNTPDAASVCAGTSVFGTAGTALCSFAQITASGMHRSQGTALMNLATEATATSYASGYRLVPELTEDDTGGSGTVIPVARPAVDCGSTGTIAARIANCALLNPSAASWDGTVNGNAGQGRWQLVSRMSGHEAWRDQQTGLVWSEASDAGADWCDASGNGDAADGFFCNGNLESACAEFAGANELFVGDDYLGGSYADQKGGLGALTVPSVRWRLPTKYDYQTADNHGLRFVLKTPGANRLFWTATVSNANAAEAVVFDDEQGLVSTVIRSSASVRIRCVAATPLP